MKAVLVRSFGGPEELSYGDHPDPEPREGEALVRVRACALNHLDLWVRAGIPAYKIALPHILGCDIAGEIASWGPGVTGLEAGAKVVVAPGVSCGACAFCLGGLEQRCESYGILGAQGGPGGYAQYARVPARNLMPLPKGLSFEEAASFPLTFLTAWHMAVTLGGLKAGQTVLIPGAGSGVSVAAVQIAKLCGARAVVSSRSDEKLRRALALGADDGILSPPEDLLRSIVKKTGGRGIDLVLEHVGPAVFEKALKALKNGGRLVTCGATTGPVLPLDLRYVFSRELSIIGAKMGSLAELREVARLVEAGRLKPVVDRVFPLKEARAAHEYLARGGQFGKVVLAVD